MSAHPRGRQTFMDFSVSAGDYHTVGLKADGTVVATEFIGNQGDNYGQCNVSDWKDIKTTKGHQLALSTTFFCPIQHILWYGKPKEYTNETEVEYFKSLPTVWDDYKVIEGMPQEYFSIARKKDNKWFLATYTANNRETTIKLDFLESGKLYDAITYEDDNQNTIKNLERKIKFFKEELTILEKRYSEQKTSRG